MWRRQSPRARPSMHSRRRAFRPGTKVGRFPIGPPPNPTANFLLDPPRTILPESNRFSSCNEGRQRGDSDTGRHFDFDFARRACSRASCQFLCSLFAPASRSPVPRFSYGCRADFESPRFGTRPLARRRIAILRDQTSARGDRLLIGLRVDPGPLNPAPSPRQDKTSARLSAPSSVGPCRNGHEPPC